MAYVYEPFLYVLEYARLDFIAQVVEQPDTGVNGKHILEYESALIQVFPERMLDLFFSRHSTPKTHHNIFIVVYGLVKMIFLSDDV